MSTSLRRGLTLLELVVGCAIIVIMLGLLVPAVRRVQETGNCIKCRNNLRQVTLAAVQVHEGFGYLPSNPDTLNGRTVTIQYCLLPYME
jgi:hypothetical protein